MTKRLVQVAPLIEEMRRLGADLLLWRTDTEASHIHAKAELKTEADRRAHLRLKAALNKLDAGVPIISEEDAVHESNRPLRYWLIDPIDGTASWLEGFDGFVSQVALMEGSEPVLGLVYAPALDLFYMAAKGEGAWLNGRRMPELGRREGLTMIDNTPEPRGLCASLFAHMSATGYVESGSLGLKLCRIADGTADLFVKDVVVRDWDLAPAKVLLDELGGMLTDLDAVPYRFSGAWEKASGFIAARDPATVLSCVSAIDALGGKAKEC
ncbi:inositol monophosphatase family protein [Cognatiyoonia sp. IB215446]|uniref:3'(2'),5'-bisphosphate nucleotidase CysQ family protein n=1 Tax=Cognatiyoonia sp. IB215446 TaxID=3097355 RepID=UPI002A0CE8BA|nr:inositol monophosphatase family protein [Cognatiyoonia sp. IB215446]MDX8349283.1 inositol monophosphatase family protein [Cognatiyoonia sp. IB215446]